jgi:hypothetical protein
MASSTDHGGDLSDYDAAVKEYHASRARYIRTVTDDTEQKLLETVAKRRAPLMEEITNLTALARLRFETRQESLKAYGAKAPGRVTSASVQPPLPGSGADKLYKAAIKAAEEFAEVNDILKKRKEKLEAIDAEVRKVLEQHGRDLIAALESPVGLEGAFKRDPLLERAHSRMVAAEARRTSARTGGTPAGVPAADG